MAEPLKIWEMSPGESVRVLLPDGIGYVEIRTGNVHGPTGYPVVAIEVVSETLDKPAEDGRMYEPVGRMHDTVLLVGYPDNEKG